MDIVKASLNPLGDFDKLDEVIAFSNEDLVGLF